jgi:phosphatidylserine/phosphatidylglycerophosphate/cardiolipin synthase-like enzyme
VDDGNHETDTDTVVITVRNVVENQPPVADAGTSQRVGEGDDVTLSGLASFDPDGDLLTYSWNQTAGPSVELNNASSANPTFSAPQVSDEETLTFLLKVSDGNSSSTDNVNVYTVDAATSHVLLGTPDYMNDVANRIKDAKQFVYVAMYYAEPYPTNKIINELEKAKDRGVDVRLVFSEHNVATYPTVEKEMSDRGIPYKVISNHAKVVVIDNKTAYVGSANWNHNGLENNQELSLKTNNPDTIREAFEYVDILWEKGGVKVDYADKPAERFANGFEFYNLLLDSLKNATSVKLLMFEATYNFADPDAVDSKVLNEIRNAHDRGADLKLLFDDPTYYVRGTGHEFLTQNGIPHRLDEKNEGPGERLHAKAVLIDDKILFVGSQNWNEDSIASPDEASIVTRDSQTISDFLVLFNEKWDVGHPPP